MIRRPPRSTRTGTLFPYTTLFRSMSGDARKLLRVGLANYAAGALLMPYGRFAEAAIAERHDVERLAQRFGVSFEQVCHRLSTLQRPGARGVPFFFVRVDMAGNITKRHSATRLQFARYCGPRTEERRVGKGGVSTFRFRVEPYI